MQAQKINIDNSLIIPKTLLSIDQKTRFFLIIV